MLISRALFFTIVMALGLQSQPVDKAQLPKKTLFVYDQIDTTSKIFIETFREQMNKSGVHFDEMMLTNTGKKDVSGYTNILIYSRVMVFNMSSPVRKWLHSLKTLTTMKIFLFVTANRWFEKKNMQQVVKLVSERSGVVVDAVSMATKDLNKKQKIESASKFIAKMSHY